MVDLCHNHVSLESALSRGFLAPTWVLLNAYLILLTLNISFDCKMKIINLSKLALWSFKC